jgi:hypothetical protein
MAATPEIFVQAPDGVSYAFPSCSITRDYVHNLIEIPLPADLSDETKQKVGAIVKSLCMATEGFRLVGEWTMTDAFAQADAFCSAWLSSDDPGTLTWKTLTKNVFAKEIHFDSLPGKGQKMLYNIVLAVSREL